MGALGQTGWPTVMPSERLPQAADHLVAISSIDDIDVLAFAIPEHCLCLTLDKDFSELRVTTALLVNRICSGTATILVDEVDNFDVQNRQSMLL